MLITSLLLVFLVFLWFVVSGLVGFLIEGLGHHERVVLGHEGLHHFLERVGF